MARHHTSIPKKILYVLLSFLLSCTILVLSLSVVLRFTVFNQSFVIDSMEKVSYYELLRAEILRNLKDLGYASGIDESFFDNFLDEAVIREDVTKYISNFYSGEKTVVNTQNFKNVFNTALDKYIVEKSIKPDSVSKENREYLVDKAVAIYKKSVQIPFLGRLAGYFTAIKNVLPIVIGVSSVLSLFFIIILLFSTRWKHRSVRYICYSAITVFITMSAVFIALISTKKMRNLNITSKAIYDLFNNMSDRFTMVFLYGGIFFAVLSMALFILFRYLYPRRKHSHIGKGSLDVSQSEPEEKSEKESEEE